jgi:preprotein translocase subunit SecE
VEEALPAVQGAHGAQRDEVAARATHTQADMASIVTRTRDFTAEVVDEMKKVTWPDWAQLKNSTLVILVFVIVVAFIIWVMDIGVRTVLNIIMDLFAS